MPPVPAIGHHAADEGKKEDRNLAEEAVQPEQKRGSGDLQHQPALRQLRGEAS
jgi:hypothetical protein